MNIKQIESAKFVEINDRFKLKISKYDIESSVGRISFEIKSNGAVVDTQNIVFFSTSKANYVNEDDIIILDGRTVDNVSTFDQGNERVIKTSISGGNGNGDGILDKGEDVLIFIRLAQGFSQVDTSTFHRTYLLNANNYEHITVDQLKYVEKIRQAGATSISSFISVSDEVPPSAEFDLWFKVENLKNEHTAVADNIVYAHKYDYRRAKLQIGKSNKNKE